MIARSASIRAFTRRDGVRLVAIGLLIIVALGLIVFGAYSLADTRYRKI